MDGYDPYSNSKSCSELVTHSYKKSFFVDGRCAISTARAGNVIGGGDFAKDRIIPDCVRAIEKKEDIIVRNPYSTRPYQHVLEPLYIYLEIAEKQYKDGNYQGYYNVGPDDCDCVNTGDLVTKFCDAWGRGAKWINKHDGGPHEAAFLKLDNSKIKEVFGWTPRWHIDECIRKIAYQFCLKNNIDLNWLLITSVYSEERKDANLITTCIQSLKEGRTFECTKLEQQWDYLHIDDLIQAMYLVGRKRGKVPYLSCWFR